MYVWHLLFLRIRSAAAAAFFRSLGRDLSGLHSRRATPSRIRVGGENKTDAVVVGRRGLVSRDDRLLWVWRKVVYGVC
jgi:hypothetical protein